MPAKLEHQLTHESQDRSVRACSTSANYVRLQWRLVIVILRRDQWLISGARVRMYTGAKRHGFILP